MLDCFYTGKYDNDAVIISETDEYNYGQLKSLIAGAIAVIKDKNQNVIISENNCFRFIIKFFACIFSHKNIYLLSDIKRLSNIDFDYYLFNDSDFPINSSYKFSYIDEKEIIINFFTSGSSSQSKIIKKSLFNLIKEAKDIGNEFNIKNPNKVTNGENDLTNITVMSTTTMCHLFGMTFHLMFPLCNKLKIYTPSILYPDKINLKNSILISTPAFLNTIEKYKIDFINTPEYIISAGSKLDEKVFEYLENKTKVIEIYGSTETGVIAYKKHSNELFSLFKNVKIKAKEEDTEVQSEYIYGGIITVNDKIEIKNGNIILKNRTDRILKIYDKRINAEEIENQLKENNLVKECYILNKDNKLAILCALSKEGQNILITKGITELKKELKCYVGNYFEIIPQKWKFIDEIPRIQSGKINKTLIKHIFDVNLSFPIILNRNKTENKIECEVYFYKESNFFSGHFPEVKILPGVVQIYFAKELANAEFQIDLGQGQMRKIKFSNIIVPEQIIKLVIEKNEKQVEYKYFDDEKIYSKGIISLINVFEEIKCL